MTEGQVGESYTELGGQLPDETERERGKRKAAEMRLCESCHHMARYHHDGQCFYPVAPRGEDCGCTRKETDS